MVSDCSEVVVGAVVDDQGKGKGATSDASAGASSYTFLRREVSDLLACLARYDTSHARLYCCTLLTPPDMKGPVHAAEGPWVSARPTEAHSDGGSTAQDVEGGQRAKFADVRYLEQGLCTEQ